MIQELASHADKGLWLKPYRGIPAFPGIRPFDLVLLDERNWVIDMAAAYPTAKLADLDTPATSALVLPLRTIYSSLTHVGDQLTVSVAEEDGDGFAAEFPADGQSNLAGGKPATGRQSKETTPQEKRGFASRLVSWIFNSDSDAGRATRHALPDIGAYYWTGGAPKVFTLGDISASGFYLLTEERWTTGTMVLMTLQRTNTSGTDPRDSISVLAQAVRWGLDGMGFEFVMSDFVSLNPGLSLPGKGTDKEALGQFLRRLNLQLRE